MELMLRPNRGPVITGSPAFAGDDAVGVKCWKQNTSACSGRSLPSGSPVDGELRLVYQRHRLRKRATRQPANCVPAPKKRDRFYVPEKAAVSARGRLNFGLAFRSVQNNSGICLGLKYAARMSA
jgi:hypothetical protein